jgi:hypothetical protein|tara:strand:+ start:205 stop:435 length:231 start_codon:yes stop_codon:yes gene_type:complete
MSRLENSEYNELVDELAMLVIYALEEHEAYRHEELNQVDEDTKTLYFSPLGEEIFNEAVNQIETMLHSAGIKREVE